MRGKWYPAANIEFAYIKWQLKMRYFHSVSSVFQALVCVLRENLLYGEPQMLSLVD